MPGTFNREQEEAITHKGGPLMVLAGPGSGKTLVITYRVKWLIENAGVHPSNILVITFTRAAAEEMKKRFFMFDGMENAPVTFGTFHSIFFMILRYAYRYTAANIIREDVKRRYIKEMTENMELEIEDENEFLSGIINEISYIKGEMMSLSYYHSNNCSDELFAQIYEGYAKRLREENLIDFDDMLVFCYELLKEREDIRTLWQNKFQHILIDEFQDINKVQYEIIRMLAGKGDHLFIVGDDDQSIYKFRGANITNILNFEKEYPDAKVVKLEQNYRSCGNILAAANAVIKHNEGRKDKALWTDQGDGEKLVFNQSEDEYMEADRVVNEIIRLTANGAQYKDIALLYRTNAQSRILGEKLVMRGIPHRVYGGQNFYERKEIKDIMAYLKVVNNSTDDTYLRRIINVPKRGIGDATVDKVAAFAAANDMTLMEAMQIIEQVPGLQRSVAKISSFVELIDNRGAGTTQYII